MACSGLSSFSPCLLKVFLLAQQCLKRPLCWPGQRASWGGEVLILLLEDVLVAAEWDHFRNEICRVHWKIPLCPQALDRFKDKPELSLHALLCLFPLLLPSPPPPQKKKVLPSVVLFRWSMTAPDWRNWILLMMKLTVSSTKLLCSEASFF